AFSMTKTRNIERIVGTFSGIIVGVFCLISIHFLPALLTIAALGLFGFFLFNRSNYMVSVIFITLGIVIALNLFEGNINLILGSRILFTLIGAFLAIAGYFLIPVRQSTGMVQLAKEVSLYNAHYFQIINNRLSDERQSSFDIRLARKKAQTAMALFSDAINQMKKEPEHKWMDWSHIHHFQALAYQVNSHLVGLSLSLNKKTNRHLAYDIHSRIDALKPLLTDLNQTAERINLKKS
ncbi:MAG TPA: FUSC family protein, partial [Sphingobacterium sp.]|nr:FUSC family protein [Sphingobacterium sp.]